MKILAAACVALAFGLLAAMWRLDHVTTSLDAATERVGTLERAADSRRNTQKLLLQLDTQHTQVQAHAQALNAARLARINSGADRLSVKATCPAVRGTTATTGLADDQARAELEPASAGPTTTMLGPL
jgi:prophage endopeptidase